VIQIEKFAPDLAADVANFSIITLGDNRSTGRTLPVDNAAPNLRLAPLSVFVAPLTEFVALWCRVALYRLRKKARDL
jgi:hypothetical protein